MNCIGFVPKRKVHGLKVFEKTTFNYFFLIKGLYFAWKIRLR